MHNETQPLQDKTVDRFTQEKLYIQLTRLLLGEIHSGNWKLGQKIPSEEELCRKYGVSKITVRQAISNLAADGYLMKYQGRGTFVTSSLPVVGLAMKTRLAEEMFGKEVKAERKILFRGVTEAPPEVKKYLATGEELYTILSRRTVDGQTAYLEESFIPVSMLPGIEGIDISRASLCTVLQEQGTKKIFKVIQTIEITAAEGETAGNLDVDQGFPLLVVHRLFLSSDNMPVAYTKLLGRSDRYKLQTEFERIR